MRSKTIVLALFASLFLVEKIQALQIVLPPACDEKAHRIAANGVLYFVTSCFIPETKGKSLEELERLFEGGGKGRNGEPRRRRTFSPRMM